MTMTSMIHCGIGVQPAQQVRRERDERVAEQQLEQQQDHQHDGRDDQAQDVGRRTADRLANVRSPDHGRS